MAYKLLYDITLQTLAVHKAGLYRVADKIFQHMASDNQIDIYPFVGTSKGSAETYLKEIGAGRLIAKIFKMPEAKYSAKSGIKSNILSLCAELKYKNAFKKFDGFFSPFLPIPQAVYSSGIKTAIMVHDLIPIYHPEFSNPQFVREYSKWIKNIRSDIVFCNSAYTAKEFLKFRTNYPKNKVITTLLGAGEDFHPESKKANVKFDKYFLGCSSASKRKNFPHLVDAFRQFIQSGKFNVGLVIAGNPAEEIAYDLRGIEDKVIFTGHVGDDELIKLYSGALAFVYPSLYEGFGLPVLEAMKCGAPVICCNNSSLPEVGGDAALYISGANLEETAATLSLIYHNSNIRQEMKQKGFTQTQNFSWEKCSNEIIQEIINEDSY